MACSIVSLQGLAVMEGTDGETHTKGLDTLADRCVTYQQQGARFSKWRAALKVQGLSDHQIVRSMGSPVLRRLAIQGLPQGMH